MTTTLKAMKHSLAAIVLAGAVVVAAAIPAFAQEAEATERRGFSGTMTEYVHGESITVSTASGATHTADLNENVTYRFPSGDVRNISIDDLSDGAEVAVLAQVEADGSLTALWVLVKPKHPRTHHVVGTVVSMEDNVLTIMDGRGNTRTVTLPEQARRGLEIGDVATFVAQEENDSDNGDTGPMTANASVTARQIQERAQQHAEALRERAQSGERPVMDVESRLAFLSDLMDRINNHVQGVLGGVRDRVPEHARPMIQQAMERAQQGFAQAREDIGRGSAVGSGQPQGGPPSDRETNRGTGVRP